MATDDDDFLTADVPEPDAEPTTAEVKRARAFADLVDKAIAGKTPPALSADDRALLEVATVIRAASGGLALPEDRQRVVVEGALRQAIGDAAPAGAVTPIARARARRRWVPWAVAATSTAVAAAAVIALWLRGPSRPPAEPRAAEIPTSWRSRPADTLIGPIARERAGDAATRIDAIFADRLDGYRERRLTPARRGPR